MEPILQGVPSAIPLPASLSRTASSETLFPVVKVVRSIMKLVAVSMLKGARSLPIAAETEAPFTPPEVPTPLSPTALSKAILHSGMAAPFTPPTILHPLSSTAPLRAIVPIAMEVPFTSTEPLPPSQTALFKAIVLRAVVPFTGTLESGCPLSQIASCGIIWTVRG